MCVRARARPRHGAHCARSWRAAPPLRGLLGPLPPILQELQAQEKMLDDLERKTDKTQMKMDNVNEKSKEALAKLNDKSTNCCIYLICLVILGALGVITYRFVVTKQGG